MSGDFFIQDLRNVVSENKLNDRIHGDNTRLRL